MSNKRRDFVKKSVLSAMGVALGAPIVFGNNLPKAIEPIGLTGIDFYTLPGKHPELRVLNDKPINAETPVHLLNDVQTPNNLFFVRNNGIPPRNIDVNNWTLTVEGESANQTKSFSLKELKSKFKEYSYNLTLECGGNGRSEFNPPAKGNQWSTGAVACVKWTGVRLKDVLNEVGIKSDAVYIGYYGSDTHLSGKPGKVPISRGVPIEKALQDESLIAWSMNGEDLPMLNGYPLRLVFGGWPASCSGKWLNKIVIRNKVHDGPKMTGKSYRVPKNPVAPGTKVEDADMKIIENMPVKSLITYPKTGATIKLNESLRFNGHAWAGDRKISLVEYSIDFGSTWKSCSLSEAININAWQQFSSKATFPKKGYYELWARATDSDGIAQPMILPGWNPRGYLNNACHRIAIKVI